MLFKKFWLKTSQLVFWDNKPQKALKKKNKHYVEWFPDGKLNIFHNCININIIYVYLSIFFYLLLLMTRFAFDLRGVIINKSTVPVTTGDKIESILSKLKMFCEKKKTIKPKKVKI